ncbi:MAG: response regulator [Candidatus Omnitrophica bacterium]|nr:response regulator [Candidatus Omnitrophota bacterium]
MCGFWSGAYVGSAYAAIEIMQRVALNCPEIAAPGGFDLVLFNESLNSMRGIELVLRQAFSLLNKYGKILIIDYANPLNFHQWCHARGASEITIRAAIHGIDGNALMVERVEYFSLEKERIFEMPRVVIPGDPVRGKYFMSIRNCSSSAMEGEFSDLVSQIIEVSGPLYGKSFSPINEKERIIIPDELLLRYGVYSEQELTKLTHLNVRYPKFVIDFHVEEVLDPDMQSLRDYLVVTGQLSDPLRFADAEHGYSFCTDVYSGGKNDFFDLRIFCGDKMLKILSQLDLRKDSLVVDFGCGEAADSRLIAEIYPHLQTYGIEPDAQNIHSILSNLKNKPLNNFHILKESFLNKLPFKMNSVSAIFMLCDVYFKFKRVEMRKAINNAFKILAQDRSVIIFFGMWGLDYLEKKAGERGMLNLNRELGLTNNYYLASWGETAFFVFGTKDVLRKTADVSVSRAEGVSSPLSISERFQIEFAQVHSKPAESSSSLNNGKIDLLPFIYGERPDGSKQCADGLCCFFPYHNDFSMHPVEISGALNKEYADGRYLNKDVILAHADDIDSLGSFCGNEILPEDLFVYLYKTFACRAMAVVLDMDASGRLTWLSHCCLHNDCKPQICKDYPCCSWTGGVCYYDDLISGKKRSLILVNVSALATLEVNNSGFRDGGMFCTEAAMRFLGGQIEKYSLRLGLRAFKINGRFLLLQIPKESVISPVKKDVSVHPAKGSASPIEDNKESAQIKQAAVFNFIGSSRRIIEQLLVCAGKQEFGEEEKGLIIDYGNELLQLVYLIEGACSFDMDFVNVFKDVFGQPAALLMKTKEFRLRKEAIEEQIKHFSDNLERLNKLVEKDLLGQIKKYWIPQDILPASSALEEKADFIRIIEEYNSILNTKPWLPRARLSASKFPGLVHSYNAITGKLISSRESSRKLGGRRLFRVKGHTRISPLISGNFLYDSLEFFNGCTFLIIVVLTTKGEKIVLIHDNLPVYSTRNYYLKTLPDNFDYRNARGYLICRADYLKEYEEILKIASGRGNGFISKASDISVLTYSRLWSYNFLISPQHGIAYIRQNSSTFSAKELWIQRVLLWSDLGFNPFVEVTVSSPVPENNKKGCNIRLPDEIIQKRVLVAEDDDDLQMTIKGHFEHYNSWVRKKGKGVLIEYVMVSNGLEASRLLDSKKSFDILITDCCMPGMTGPVLIRRARNIGLTIPIIAMSSDSDLYRRDVFDAGADFFMPKPLSYSVLIGLAFISLTRPRSSASSSLAGVSSVVEEKSKPGLSESNDLFAVLMRYLDSGDRQGFVNRFPFKDYKFVSTFDEPRETFEYDDGLVSPLSGRCKFMAEDTVREAYKQPTSLEEAAGKVAHELALNTEYIPADRNMIILCRMVQGRNSDKGNIFELLAVDNGLGIDKRIVFPADLFERTRPRRGCGFANLYNLLIWFDAAVLFVEAKGIRDSYEFNYNQACAEILFTRKEIHLEQVGTRIYIAVLSGRGDGNYLPQRIIFKPKNQSSSPATDASLAQEKGPSFPNSSETVSKSIGTVGKQGASSAAVSKSNRIYAREYIESVNKVFRKFKKTVLSSEIALSASFIYGTARILEIRRDWEAKTKEQVLLRVFKGLFEVILREIEYSRKPNKDEEALIKIAVQISRSFCDKYGFSFQDFSKDVLFGRILQHMPTADGMLTPFYHKIILNENKFQACNTNRKIMMILHEAFHYIAQGNGITWVNEGVVEWLAITAYMEFSNQAISLQLARSKTVFMLFSSFETGFKPEFPSPAGSLIGGIIRLILSDYGITIKEFLSIYMRGDMPAFIELFGEETIIKMEELDTYFRSHNSLAFYMGGETLLRDLMIKKISDNSGDAIFNSRNDTSSAAEDKGRFHHNSSSAIRIKGNGPKILFTQKDLELVAAWVRKDAFDMIRMSGAGHFGATYSVTDILVSLYFDGHLIIDDWQNRDRLILSEGHAAASLYSILSIFGFFERRELNNFRKYGSILNAHPCAYLTPGIEASTGSLGQGLGRGIGMALADKIDGRSRHTYVIFGDGESEEGQISEAAAVAPFLGLSNLIAIMDKNNLQLSGPTSKNTRTCNSAFWRMSGWRVIETDGHDFAALGKALRQARKQTKMPTIIIANTIMGKGISYMEKDSLKGNSRWHHGQPSPRLFRQGEAELIAKINLLEKQTRLTLEQLIHKCNSDRPKEPIRKMPEDATDSVEAEAMFFSSEKMIPENNTSAFIQSLIQLANSDTRIILLTSDLTGSHSLGIHVFKKEFPGRYYDIGIREQCMANISAGLADSGKRPVIVVYEAMVNLMAEQIRFIAQDNLPVIVWGAVGGVTSAMGGRSHQSSYEPALYKYIPGLAYFEPSDQNETYQLVKLALNRQGPVYFRTSRLSIPLLDRGCSSQPSKGAYVIKGEDIEHPDVIIIATGAIMKNVLEATSWLRRQNITARIINVTRLDNESLKENLKRLIIDGVPIITIHDAKKEILADTVSGIVTSFPETRNPVLALGINNWGAANGDRDPEATIKDSGLGVGGICASVNEFIIATARRKEERRKGNSGSSAILDSDEGTSSAVLKEPSFPNNLETVSKSIGTVGKRGAHSSVKNSGHFYHNSSSAIEKEVNGPEIATSCELINYLVCANRPLTEEDVILLNCLYFREYDLRSDLAGKYRSGLSCKIRDIVLDEGCQGDIVKTFPIFTGKEISEGVKSILDLLNNNPDKLGIIDLISEAHWRFIMELHPFWDKNGHTIRGVMNIFLNRWGMPKFELKEDSLEESEYFLSQSGRDPEAFNGKDQFSRIPYEAHDAYRKRNFFAYMHKFFLKRINLVGNNEPGFDPEKMCSSALKDKIDGIGLLIECLEQLSMPLEFSLSLYHRLKAAVKANRFIDFMSFILNPKYSSQTKINNCYSKIKDSNGKRAKEASPEELILALFWYAKLAENEGLSRCMKFAFCLWARENKRKNFVTNQLSFCAFELYSYLCMQLDKRSKYAESLRLLKYIYFSEMNEDSGSCNPVPIFWLFYDLNCYSDPLWVLGEIGEILRGDYPFKLKAAAKQAILKVSQFSSVVLETGPPEEGIVLIPFNPQKNPSSFSVGNSGDTILNSKFNSENGASSVVLKGPSFPNNSETVSDSFGTVGKRSATSAALVTTQGRMEVSPIFPDAKATIFPAQAVSLLKELIEDKMLETDFYRPILVAVDGESGVGKSEFCKELVKLMKIDGTLHLRVDDFARPYGEEFLWVFFDELTTESFKRHVESLLLQNRRRVIVIDSIFILLLQDLLGIKFDITVYVWADEKTRYYNLKQRGNVCFGEPRIREFYQVHKISPDYDLIVHNCIGKRLNERESAVWQDEDWQGISRIPAQPKDELERLGLYFNDKYRQFLEKMRYKRVDRYGYNISTIHMLKEKILSAMRLNPDKALVVALDGNSVFETATAEKIKYALGLEGINVVLIHGDLLTRVRMQRHRWQDHELSHNEISVNDNKISSRKIVLRGLLRSIRNFNKGRENELIYELKDLYDEDGCGELTLPPQLLTINRQRSVVIIERNYLLVRQWRKYFDLKIQMLVNPLVGLQRSMPLDNYKGTSRVKEIFWRINTPSFMHYLEHCCLPDIAIISDNWGNFSASSAVSPMWLTNNYDGSIYSASSAVRARIELFHISTLSSSPLRIRATKTTFPNNEPQLADMAVDVIGQNIHTGCRLLEIGTGSGILTAAIAMSSKNVEGVRFVATDINRDAFDDAVSNLSGFKNVKVCCGDLYDCLGPNERFHRIFSNPPWYDKCGHKVLRTLAMYDQDYKTLRRLFAGAVNRLYPNEGRLYIIFPQARSAVLYELANEHAFTIAEAAQYCKNKGEVIAIYEFMLHSNHTFLAVESSRQFLYNSSSAVKKERNCPETASSLCLTVSGRSPPEIKEGEHAFYGTQVNFILPLNHSTSPICAMQESKPRIPAFIRLGYDLLNLDATQKEKRITKILELIRQREMGFIPLNALIGSGMINSLPSDIKLRGLIIGDLHAKWKTLVLILRRAGFISPDNANKLMFCETLEEARRIIAKLKWIAGDAILVQTGDVLDVHPEMGAIICWEILAKLQKEAEASRLGGKVLRLAGNHELNYLANLHHRDSQEADRQGMYVSERIEVPKELQNFIGRQYTQEWTTKIADKWKNRIRQAVTKERSIAALRIEDRIVVHAGVDKDFCGNKNLDSLVNKFNIIFKRAVISNNYDHPVISGGHWNKRTHHGIFDIRFWFLEASVPQIVAHTPDTKHFLVNKKRKAINVDVGIIGIRVNTNETYWSSPRPGEFYLRKWVVHKSGDDALAIIGTRPASYFSGKESVSSAVGEKTSLACYNSYEPQRHYRDLIYTLDSEGRKMVPLLYVPADRLSIFQCRFAVLGLYHWYSNYFNKNDRKTEDSKRMLDELNDSLEWFIRKLEQGKREEMGGDLRLDFLRSVRLAISLEDGEFGEFKGYLYFFGSIHYIDIAPDYRGRGLGTELTMAAFQEIIGCNSMEYISVYAVRQRFADIFNYFNSVVRPLGEKKLSKGDGTQNLTLTKQEASEWIEVQRKRTQERIVRLGLKEFKDSKGISSIWGYASSSMRPLECFNGVRHIIIDAEDSRKQVGIENLMKQTGLGCGRNLEILRQGHYSCLKPHNELIVDPAVDKDKLKDFVLDPQATDFIVSGGYFESCHWQWFLWAAELRKNAKLRATFHFIFDTIYGTPGFSIRKHFSKAAIKDNLYFHYLLHHKGVFYNFALNERYFWEGFNHSDGALFYWWSTERFLSWYLDQRNSGDTILNSNEGVSSAVLKGPSFPNNLETVSESIGTVGKRGASSAAEEKTEPAYLFTKLFLKYFREHFERLIFSIKKRLIFRVIGKVSALQNIGNERIAMEEAIKLYDRYLSKYLKGLQKLIGNFNSVFPDHGQSSKTDYSKNRVNQLISKLLDIYDKGNGEELIKRDYADPTLGLIMTNLYDLVDEFPTFMKDKKVIALNKQRYFYLMDLYLKVIRVIYRTARIFYFNVIERDPANEERYRFQSPRLHELYEGFGLSWVKILPMIRGLMVGEELQDLANVLGKRYIYDFKIESALKEAQFFLTEDDIANAIYEVIRNALSAAYPGTTVEGRIFRRNKDEIVIEISNQGVNLSGFAIRNVLKYLYSTKVNIGLEGRGLGLAVARMATSINNLVIEIESDGIVNRWKRNSSRIKRQTLSKSDFSGTRDSSIITLALP